MSMTLKKETTCLHISVWGVGSTPTEQHENSGGLWWADRGAEHRDGHCGVSLYCLWLFRLHQVWRRSQ